jgi:hypothetical protein
VHLMNEYPAEVGSRILDLFDHPDDGAIGALQGVVSLMGITRVAPDKGPGLSIHPDL